MADTSSLCPCRTNCFDPFFLIKEEKEGKKEGGAGGLFILMRKF